MSILKGYIALMGARLNKLPEEVETMGVDYFFMLLNYFFKNGKNKSN